MKSQITKRFSKKNAGIILLVVVVLMSAIFAISLGIFRVVFGELLITGEISDSAFAFYAADEGIERTMYRDRVQEATLCSSLGSPCYTETATPVQSGGCYNLEMGKTLSGPLILTRVAVTGQYRCGANAVRVVKRAFDLAYWGVAPTPSPFNPDTTGNLGNGLAAYWKLDEASGTRSDSAASSHLTDNNTVTVNAGKRGNAAQFTRTNSEFLSIADNPSVSTGDIDFTIAAWGYLDSKNALMVMVHKGSTTGSDLEYGLRYDSTADRFQFLVSPAGNDIVSVNADSLGSPSIGTWYYLVGWHDSVNNTINIQEVTNGTVDSLSYTTGLADRGGVFYVGRKGDGSVFARFWDGRIDEVGLWKRVLTDQERADLYNSGNGNTYTP